MTAPDRLESELPELLEHLYLGPRPSYADDALRIAASSPRHTGMRIAGLWLSASAGSVQAVTTPRLPWRTILVVGLIALALALAAGAIVVGNDQRALPPQTGPAGNGLIAFDHAGDIYVGDSVTGMTSAIVAGPEQDRSPIFSPDGTRIAFVRRSEVGTQPAGAGHPFGNSDLTGTSDIVVVRPDGSDLRVITPERLVGLELAGWTPDSAWIEAMLFAYTGSDWTYQGWMFDASGPAEPRVSEPRVDLAQA